MIREWLSKHETNYTALLALAKAQLKAKKLADAKATLEKLVELYPEHSGEDESASDAFRDLS